MKNLPFVFLEIFTVGQYFYSLCSKKILTTRAKEAVTSEKLLVCLLWATLNNRTGVIVFMWSCLAIPNPELLGTKPLKVLLLALNGMKITPLPQDFVGFPWHFTGTHLNSWVERGMRCGSLVFCSRTHRDASDRIRTSRPRVQSAN